MKAYVLKGISQAVPKRRKLPKATPAPLKSSITTSSYIHRRRDRVWVASSSPDSAPVSRVMEAETRAGINRIQCRQRAVITRDTHVTYQYLHYRLSPRNASSEDLMSPIKERPAIVPTAILMLCKRKIPARFVCDVNNLARKLQLSRFLPQQTHRNKKTEKPLWQVLLTSQMTTPLTIVAALPRVKMPKHLWVLALNLMTVMSLL